MKRFAYFLILILVAAAWLFASWPTLLTLHQKWSDVGDSYVLGYPLILAAGWLVYLRREQLRAIHPAPSWFGMLCFAGAIFMMYAARLIQLQIVQQIMVPASLWCAVFAVTGWQVGRVLLLPIALQYFGMPVWDPLIDVLQSVTVLVAQTALGWMQIPALIQGNNIHLPYGIITVADSCSGLNLLLAALLVATLQAQMGAYDTARRIKLLLAAGAIGLLDNWVRVVGLILIAHYSRMQSPLVYDHASFGWWIYAVSLVPIFWIARRLEMDTLIRNERNPAPQFSFSTKLPIHEAVLILLVVIVAESSSRVLLARVGQVASMQISGEAQAGEASFMPHYSGYDQQQTWELASAEGRFELTALVYTRQSANKKLVYYDNVIATEGNLQMAGQMRLPTGVHLNVAVVGPGQGRAVWWYYWVDGVATTSPMRAKLYQLKASLLGDPTSALIVLSEKCDSSSCAQALQTMEAGGYPRTLEQMLSVKGRS